MDDKRAAVWRLVAALQKKFYTFDEIRAILTTLGDVTDDDVYLTVRDNL